MMARQEINLSIVTRSFFLFFLVVCAKTEDENSEISQTGAMVSDKSF